MDFHIEEYGERCWKYPYLYSLSLDLETTYLCWDNQCYYLNRERIILLMFTGGSRYPSRRSLVVFFSMCCHFLNYPPINQHGQRENTIEVLFGNQIWYWKIHHYQMISDAFFH
jgi:hypothetical protein